MGNWEKKQDEKRDIRERERVSKETLGKFFYDLSKLSFAALVIGSVASVVINKNNIDSYIIMSIGAFVTYIFAYIGYKIIKSNRYGSINRIILHNGSCRISHSDLA